MATSIAEQIAVKVKARLELIDGTGSYETTASEVNRPIRLDNPSPQDYQLIVTQGDMTENLENSHPGNPPATAWDLPFRVAGVLRASEDSTTANDTFKNQFTADVMAAIGTASSGDWAQWDGLAINTSRPTVEDFESDDGASVGFVAEFVVTFRTSETDLYTARA